MQGDGDVTNKFTENEPTAVPVAKQVGKTLTKWWWVEPEIWTERMLAALETGVKGGNWFSLIDKVFSYQNLNRAFQMVKKNQGTGGTDHQTIAEFDSNLEEEIKTLAQELRDGTYQPRLIRRHYIPKPGTKELRPLGIPCVRDRTVQTVIRNVIEPIFEIGFSEKSYGFRPGLGCKDALRHVDTLLKQGYSWVVDIDLKSYFDTIPHAELMSLVELQISDGRMLKLINSFLKQGILDGLKEWEPEQGTPQGALCKALHKAPYAK
jgi:RNA-directed DNA polymerase